mmetsp:Transcript_26468/g.49202  ORF Transcript_26468/g.49202 Transcript_26468/m.49202 type:complete len:120 (-) Transcript_26468:193-552(-)
MADLKIKSQSLEEQLMSMCTSSSQVTQHFIQIKNELETENASLAEQAAEMRTQLEGNEQCIEELERENYEVQSQVDGLMERVKGLNEIMAAMSGQRDQLLRTADRWEDALQVCEKTGEV